MIAVSNQRRQNKCESTQNSPRIPCERPDSYLACVGFSHCHRHRLTLQGVQKQRQTRCKSPQTDSNSTSNGMQLTHYFAVGLVRLNLLESPRWVKARSSSNPTVSNQNPQQGPSNRWSTGFRRRQIHRQLLPKPSHLVVRRGIQEKIGIIGLGLALQLVLGRRIIAAIIALTAPARSTSGLALTTYSRRM